MASLQRMVPALLVLVASLGATASAVDVRTIATGIDDPTAVAVRAAEPGGERHVFVLQRNGAVSAYGAEEAGQRPVVLIEPSKDASTRSTALLVIGRNGLVVGSHEVDSGERRVRAIRIAKSAEGFTVAFHRTLSELLPAQSPRLAGACTALAANGRYVFAAVGGEGGGMLMRARHTSGILTDFRPLSTVSRYPAGTRPVGLAISERGYLAAMVERSSDSQQLVLLAPESLPGAGSAVAMDVTLPGACALAYSPTPRPIERRLYCLSKGGDGFASGVYRIDSALDDQGRATVQATPVHELTGPTAMAFDPSGRLYVTLGGESPGRGSLVELNGEL